MTNRIFCFLTLGLLAFDASGCVKQACEVIDAANKGCHLLQYLTADGKVESVEVSTDELTALGRAASARRAAAARDGGADAGR